MPAITISSPTTPPNWALLQRELMRAQATACEIFYHRYFDNRGYLKCIPRWGGNDGPDDAIENLTGYSMVHTLGGPQHIFDLYKQAWEGHIQQYSEAVTVDVPIARSGMYYKDFPACFDWFHHGESLTIFNLQGLSDPHEVEFGHRTKKYAGFYMDEDPQAKNYDPEHKIIRSLFNGSRGPLLRKATALDWAGDNFEVEGRFLNPRHGESTFEEMLMHFQEYTDVVGDQPLNLAATTLGLNAYALSGEEKYKNWLLEYVDAWADRAAQNNGILPSNIGLDGTVGGECDGKWYGGCYGWGFTVVVPQNGTLSDRNALYRGVAGFGNALLLTGDQKYPNVWGTMLNNVNSNSKTEDGQTLYPHMYGDDGWYGFKPQPYNQGALDVYYWTMNEADLQYVPQNPWLDFLQGKNQSYPTDTLRNALSSIRTKMETVRNDNTSTDTRLSDDPIPYNPATTVNTLIQQQLGGLAPRHGEPLHARVRYFDQQNQRPGLPQDVAALVESLTADSVTLSLVNINQTENRDVIIQAGAYAEHQFTNIDTDGTSKSLNSSWLLIRLAPGSGAKLTLKTDRYVNMPTFSFPWERDN
ncbi:MAG: hypothetical protein HOH77_23270 [Candidatus Latescibacteria bacterium]|nr:hypothetical protein [Candidatus Latescibacterota bacterium]